MPDDTHSIHPGSLNEFSEPTLRQLAERLGDALWIMDSQRSRLFYVNPAYEVIWGRKASNLYRNPGELYDSIHPEDRDRVVAALARQVQGGYLEEYRIVTPEGVIHWIKEQVFPIFDKAGQLDRLIGIASDITASRTIQDELYRLNRQLEARIAERTERLHRMIETSTEAVVTIDRNGCVEEWNAAAEALFGWSRDEAIGVLLSEMIIPYRYRQAHEAGLRSAIVTGQGAVLNKTLALSALKRSGEEFPIELSVWPVRCAEGYIFSAFLRDITERVKTEAELRQAEADVRKALLREQELNELKSRFVAMASHEFRTPLTAILSSAELLEAYGERLSAEKKGDLIGMIKSAVKSMTHMLEEVLFIGKSDTGHLQFNPEAMDLERFCARLLKEIRAGVGKDHVIDYRAAHLEAPVMADPHLLRQILLNLLSNGLKFSPKGSRIGFSCSRYENALCFEVVDQGLGIPEEDRDNLFNTFYRAGNVSNVQGTGLGLAIVKKCVELHGGEIEYSSELGKGTRFMVRIPFDAGDV